MSLRLCAPQDITLNVEEKAGLEQRIPTGTVARPLRNLRFKNQKIWFKKKLTYAKLKINGTWEYIKVYNIIHFNITNDGTVKEFIVRYKEVNVCRKWMMSFSGNYKFCYSTSLSEPNESDEEKHFWLDGNTDFYPVICLEEHDYFLIDKTPCFDDIIRRS